MQCLPNIRSLLQPPPAHASPPVSHNLSAPSQQSSSHAASTSLVGRLQAGGGHQQRGGALATTTGTSRYRGRGSLAGSQCVLGRWRRTTSTVTATPLDASGTLLTLHRRQGESDVTSLYGSTPSGGEQGKYGHVI